MHRLGATILTIAILTAGAYAAPSASAQTTPTDLFPTLLGKTCQGTMRLTKVATPKAPPTDIPVRIDWLRHPDDTIWANFKYGTRAPVLRPAHITEGGLRFTGAYGQLFAFQGTATDLTSPTATDDASGTVTLHCTEDPAATLPVPPQAATLQQFDVPSKINGQTYRLMLRVPQEPPPAGGYPVLYVLDGNYYFGTVYDEAERMIPQRIVRPFVVVAVGYPTADRPEQNAYRTFDLTLSSQWPPGRFGGADAFLRVLDEELRPFVATHVPVSATDQSLYGHSFGALTALRELFRRPNAFSAYILSSPSIWWNHNEILADEPAFSRQASEGHVHAKILITSAGDEQGSDPEGLAERMVDNASDLAARLEQLRPMNMPVTRVIFDGEIHASVPQASTSRAVRFAIPPP